MEKVNVFVFFAFTMEKQGQKKHGSDRSENDQIATSTSFSSEIPLFSSLLPENMQAVPASFGWCCLLGPPTF